jgi:hypothetical protein
MTPKREHAAIAGAILLLLAVAYMLTRKRSPRPVSDPQATADTNSDYQPNPQVDDADYYRDYHAANSGSTDTKDDTVIDPANPPSGDAEKIRHDGGHNHLRVTTYNIKYTSGNGDVQQSLTRLLPDADIMILNEFTTPHTPIFQWLSAQGWGHYYPKGSDTAIIYRKSAASFVDGKRYELSPPTWAEAPEHDDRHDNRPTRHLPAAYAPAATFAVDGNAGRGVTVTVIGAHTVSHVHNEHGKRPRRGALQTQQFKALVSAIRRESRRGLVIGGGDLNYDPVHEKATARNVTAILADAHLRSNWTWLGEHGNGTLGGRFVDQFLTLTGQEPRLKLTGQRIVSGLHSDHNAVQATYQL